MLSVNARANGKLSYLISHTVVEGNTIRDLAKIMMVIDCDCAVVKANISPPIYRYDAAPLNPPIETCAFRTSADQFRLSTTCSPDICPTWLAGR